MGVIKQLALAPLAPLRLSVWVSEKVREEAARQSYSQGAVVSRLREVEAAAERGEITEQEAQRRQGQIVASRMQGTAVSEAQGGESDG
jgi:Gas vesicle protein G